MSTLPPNEAPAEFVPPPGVVIQQSIGKITGQALYKVADFAMPLMSSPERALEVYRSLRSANESGYFTGGSKKDATSAQGAPHV